MATMEQIRLLGYEAARKRAERTNAGNANSFAAHSISQKVECVFRNTEPDYLKLIELQSYLSMDLHSVFDTGGDEKAMKRNASAFVGGAMAFASDNPDD